MACLNLEIGGSIRCLGESPSLTPDQRARVRALSKEFSIPPTHKQLAEDVELSLAEQVRIRTLLIKRAIVEKRKRVKGLKVFEIALVDRPAVPAATFVLVRDEMVEED